MMTVGKSRKEPALAPVPVQTEPVTKVGKKRKVKEFGRESGVMYTPWPVRREWYTFPYVLRPHPDYPSKFPHGTRFRFLEDKTHRKQLDPGWVWIQMYDNGTEMGVPEIRVKNQLRDWKERLAEAAGLLSVPKKAPLPE